MPTDFTPIMQSNPLSATEFALSTIRHIECIQDDMQRYNRQLQNDMFGDWLSELEIACNLAKDLIRTVNQSLA